MFILLFASGEMNFIQKVHSLQEGGIKPEQQLLKQLMTMKQISFYQ